MIDFSRYLLHDLSHTFTDDLPGYSWEQARTKAKDGWNARQLTFYSHAGTHMDAPRHFAVNEGSIDAFTPAQLTGNAWIIRVPIVADNQLLDVDILEPILADWQPGDSLLIHTGWDRFLHTDFAYFRAALPRISTALATWCVANEVKMLGVEPPSVADVNNLPEVTRIHEILLAGNVIIIEGLTRLEAIKKDRVSLIALPLKIGGGDGCPARVIALEER